MSWNGLSLVTHYTEKAEHVINIRSHLFANVKKKISGVGSEPF